METVGCRNCGWRVTYPNHDKFWDSWPDLMKTFRKFKCYKCGAIIEHGDLKDKKCPCCGESNYQIWDICPECGEVNWITTGEGDISPSVLMAEGRRIRSWMKTPEQIEEEKSKAKLPPGKLVQLSLFDMQ